MAEYIQIGNSDKYLLMGFSVDGYPVLDFGHKFNDFKDLGQNGADIGIISTNPRKDMIGFKHMIPVFPYLEDGDKEIRRRRMEATAGYGNEEKWAVITSHTKNMLTVVHEKDGSITYKA